MPTASFPCTQCSKAMAVDTAYLGKAVRCPHCKAVVTAPAEAPAPAPTPEPVPANPPAPPQDDASIFVEPTDDDLFGRGQRPTVEVPPSPPPPPGLEPTVFQAPADGPPPDGTRRSQSPPQVNMAVLSALVILVPYALFVTAIAIYLYISSAAQPHPFEMLPDDGEPKASRQRSGVSKQRFRPTEPLPEHLVVPLGQALTVGDLQVTPRSVEERNLVFHYRTGRYTPSPSREPALVLNLELHNVSKDVWFRPTDPRFDHLWKANMPSQYPLNVLPYTHLNIGEVYYCSPLPFGPGARLVRRGDNLLDEYVSGQEDDSRILGPGDTMKTVICTDPKDQAPAALARHEGPVMWRVKLRRGLVEYEGRDRSCAFVFGVTFDKSQVVKK